MKVLKVDPNSDKLKKYDYDNSEPVDENGDIIEFDSSNTDKNDKAHKEREKSRKKNRQ